ncbi:MAG: hypothetical protein KF705_15170 [Phycisphaeraceae bacterium]|nr:hypothetical protein [Phycisphaeraceae bacterium]
MDRRKRHTRVCGVRVVLGSAVCAIMLGAGAGCAAVGVAAVAAKSIEESRPKKVKAEYTGLVGKSYAVVVAADRSVQSEYPTLVTDLTARINDRLWTNSGAAAGVPAQELLRYLYENPSWTARPYSELAATLGVERLVVIDLNEFRLNDPGNRYLWDGVAAGAVSVIEADGSVPDEFVFQRAIRVGFPDVTGVEQEQFTARQIASVLIARFVNRAAWLFYDHEEEAQIKY